MRRKLGYYWKESKGIVLSLAITAAVLPFALWAFGSRQRVMTWVKASPSGELMVWFDPAEIVMSVGQTTTLDVLAEYSGNDRLIPALKTKINGSSGLRLGNDNIEYDFGFSGRKKLGSVTVTAVGKGSQTVSIAENNVFTSLPDLPIVTAGARIIVK
jgi:hypothetical protein